MNISVSDETLRAIMRTLAENRAPHVVSITTIVEPHTYARSYYVETIDEAIDVNLDTIRLGVERLVQRVLDGRCRPALLPSGGLQFADAVQADLIMQLGAFDELRYG